MKKNYATIILIFLMSVFLLSCQQQDDSFDLKEVNIYESTEFKKENLVLIVSSNETENMEIFETVRDIISDASKQDGVADMIEPNYYLEIIYNDNSTKEFYLWLLDVEGGKGSFMEIEDTHTVYNFSEELNSKLIYLIDSLNK